MSLPFAVDDVLTLASGVWRVDSLRYVPYLGAKSRVARPGDDPSRITVGLDDPANPGKHGTAVSLDVLMIPGRAIKHDATLHSKAGQVDTLATDLVTSGWLWGRGAAEVVAARLVDLGWRR